MWETGFRKSLESFTCGQASLPCITSGQQFDKVHLLALSCDVLHIDVPGPADDVGKHEALHQFGVAVRYVAGVQDAFVAGVTRFKCPNDQYLDRHTSHPHYLKMSASSWYFSRFLSWASTNACH